MLTALAPGKVVLFGEYAVLDGAPALAVAVDQAVGAAFAPGPALRFDCPADDRVVAATWTALGGPTGTVRTWDAPPWTGPKAGLGGSAATVVAATLLAAAASGGPLPQADALTSKAIDLHRAIMGGGSGLDVATSVWGGFVRFSAGRAERAAPGPLPVLLFTGRSASTAPRVRRYLDHPDRTAFVTASVDALACWPADPIEATRRARAALHELDRAAGLGWSTPHHEALHAAAARLGGACKPSGAGGGDIAVAWLPDAGAEAAFVASLPTLGATRLPLVVAEGARVLPASRLESR